MIVNKRINNKLLVISEYINELELDNCRLSNSDEILNNVIKEKDKEIDKLKKELEIEQDISEGMLETIDKAIEYIESNPLVCIYDTYMYVTDIEQLEKGIPDLKFFRTLKEILKKEENNESSDINREIN